MNSLYVLIKSASGDGWDTILVSVVAIEEPTYVCNKISGYSDYLKYGITDCGNAWYGFFLVIFQFLVGEILLNLFIAVIIDSFKSALQLENQIVTKDDIEKF